MSVERIADKPQVPEIYHLIARNAPVAELSTQLYKDFVILGDAEKACLGIRAILSRGFEGRAALMQMATGSDELSLRVAELLKREPIVDSDIEAVLGIKRFGEIVSNENHYFEEVFYYLRKRGKFSELGAFWDRIIQDRDRYDGSFPQLIGTVDDYLLSIYSTFGSSEPSYLETMGSEEVLRLRTLEEPKMLLLGSQGKYSAREFRGLAEKININTKTTVIDRDPVSIEIMEEEPLGNTIIQADAVDLPFADESMDQIFTNFLFHIAAYKDSSHETRGTIAKIMREVSRVLKADGSFVICEREFQKGVQKKREGITDELIYRFNLIAGECGLKPVRVTNTDLNFALREEQGTSVIDENGFAHYENSLISRLPDEGVCIMYKKS